MQGEGQPAGITAGAFLSLGTSAVASWPINAECLSQTGTVGSSRGPISAKANDQIFMKTLGSEAVKGTLRA